MKNEDEVEFDKDSCSVIESVVGNDVGTTSSSTTTKVSKRV